MVLVKTRNCVQYSGFQCCFVRVIEYKFNFLHNVYDKMLQQRRKMPIIFTLKNRGPTTSVGGAVRLSNFNFLRF